MISHFIYSPNEIRDLIQKDVEQRLGFKLKNVSGDFYYGFEMDADEVGVEPEGFHIQCDGFLAPEKQAEVIDLAGLKPPTVYTLFPQSDADA